MPVLPKPHHYLLDLNTPLTYVFLGAVFIYIVIIISRKSLTYTSITILKLEDVKKDSSDLNIKPSREYALMISGITYTINEGTEVAREIIEPAIWRRHTRVFGGRVCPGCEPGKERMAESEILD
jgi:hypothetical protein